MRRLYSFWMLFALASGFVAVAQPAPFKKAAQMKTQQVYYINDGESTRVSDKFLNYYNYDKAGNCLSDVKYNFSDYTQEWKLNESHIYTYDTQGKLLTDLISYGGKPSDLVENEYNDKGLIVKSYGYSMHSGKKLSQSFDYEYDANGNLEEKTEYRANGDVYRRTVYSYDNNKLSEAEEYLMKNGNPTQSAIINYFYDDLGQLVKDSTTQVSIGKDGTTYYNPSGWNIYGYENGRLIADSTYASDFETGKVEPNMRHLYKYDAEGNLVKKTDVGYNNKVHGFVNDYMYYDYTLVTYNVNRMPTNVAVTASDKLATVNIAFQAPSDKTGLEGYKVMVDGVLLDKLYPASTTSIELDKQVNGTHTYGIAGIYNGTPSIISDMVTYEVKIALPVPTGLQAPLYRFDKTWTRWYIQLKWNAVDPGDLTLLGYEIMLDGRNGDSAESTDTSIEVNYDGLKKIPVQLYAVYEEGTSDPIEITLDLSDPKNEITENWQNAAKVTKDLVSGTTATTRYIYGTSPSSERVVAQVEYDAAGVATARTEFIYDYGKVIQEYHSTWNNDNWTWKEDKVVTYEENDLGDLSAVITETLDSKGELTESEKDEYVYDDDNALEKINRYELVNGQLAITSVIKLSSEDSKDIRTFYTPDESSVTGKEETVYDGKNVTSKTVYTYNGTAYTVKSAVTYKYSSTNGLVESEEYAEMKNGKLTAVSNAKYTPSSAYSATHIVSDLVAKTVGDKVNLSWTAPARTADLTGYQVLVNDVKYGTPLAGHTNGEVVEKDVTTTVLAGIPAPKDCDYKVIAVYTAGEATASDLAKIKEGTGYANLKALIEAKPQGQVVVDGEVLVTGKMGDSYFIEDETAALQLKVGELDTFPYAVGDKITNLTGGLDLGFYPTFGYESADKTSSGNKVEATVKTMAEILENPTAYFARFIKFENVTFKDIPEGMTELPSLSTMVQGESTMDLVLGQLQLPIPKKAVNVSGFVVVTTAGEGLMMIFTDAKNMETYRVKYADLKSMCEGATTHDEVEYTGEAVVTGSMSVGYGDGSVFIQDETGALQLVLGELSNISLQKGDKITNLIGVMDALGGIHTFDPYSVEIISQGNPVSPKVQTVAEVAANTAAYEAQFIKFEKVTLEPTDTGYSYIIKQGEDEMELFAGYSPLGELPELVDVSGFIGDMGVGWMLMLPGTEYIEASPKTFATLKEMLDAGEDPDFTPYKVSGEVLVTGNTTNGRMNFYFVEDATAAVCIQAGEVGAPFNYQAGDKIKNLKGYLNGEAGMRYLEYISAEKVSDKNAVNPTVMTVAAVKENAAANESKFVKFENVTITPSETAGYQYVITQGDATVYMLTGMVNIESMPTGPVNVAGFVGGTGDDTMIWLAGEEYLEETTRTFANLKEMIEAGMAENKTDIVTGEVLLTGIITLSAEMGTAYFVEDESAAIRLVMGEDVKQFTFKVGDKIKNMTGMLDEFEGVRSFTFSSAEKVSSDNKFEPTVITLAALNANLEANESRYLQIEGVTFDVTEDVLPSMVEMTQGAAHLDLFLGGIEIPTPKAEASVAGFLSLEGNHFLILNGKKDFTDAISTLEVSGMYYQNGKVVAEGASMLEVYDVTGRRLAYAANGEVSVSGITGTVVVKAVYANGEVEVMKLAVK